MDDHFQIYPEKVSFCWLVNKEAGPPIYLSRLRHISKSWSRCGGLPSKIGQVMTHRSSAPQRMLVRSFPCVQSNRVAKAFMKMKKGLYFQLHSMILQSVTTMAKKNHRTSAPQRMLVTRWRILLIHCMLIVRSRTTKSSKPRVSSSLRYPYLISTSPP